MDPRVDSLLVPSALLRVRQFLSQSGLKVRPWSPPEEALGALEALLVARAADAAFWDQLQVLFGELSADVRRRRAAGTSAVANEVLEPGRHAALLSELRRALAVRPTPGFSDLARGLSRQALGALCLVAGVALVGCGGTTREDDVNGLGGMGGNGPSTPSGGLGGAVTGGAGGIAVPGGTGGVLPGGAGGLIIIPETGGTGGDPATCELTLEQILSDCVDDETYRQDLLDCVNTLNDSWHAGIERLLQCTSCDEVQGELCRLLETCSDPELGAEYSLEEFVDHCVVVLYRGVAFE